MVGASMPASRAAPPMAALFAAALVVCCALLTVVDTGQAAAATLSWSAPVPVAGNVMYDISCPTETLCVAVGAEGEIVTSTDPAGGAPAWHAVKPDGFFILDSIDCPSESLCVAGDDHGRVLVSTKPTTGVWEPASVGSGPEAISCYGETLCVAVDGGKNVVFSTDPTGGSAAWTLESIDPVGSLYGISCPSLSLCVATDHQGNAFTTAEPTGAPSAWHEANVDGSNGLYRVSCPSSTLCLAADDQGNVLTSTDPAATKPTWTVANVDMTNALYGVSCASASRCVATDFIGDVAESTNPTGGPGEWSVTHIDGLEAVYGISCPTETMCVAADSAGNILVGAGSGGTGGGGTGGGGSGGSGGLGGSGGSGGSGVGGTGGGGGGGSGGGVGSGQPIAHLIVGQQKPGGSLVLDGSGSGGEGVSGFGFKLSSGGEVRCGPQAPVVQASFAGPAIGTATLSVLTTRGIAATATTSYTSTGPRLLKRGSRAAVKYLSRQALVSAQCLPAPASAPSPLAIGGSQVNASCEVHAGLVDAVGCGLRQVSLCSGVPAAERKLLEAHLNQYAGCFVRHELLGAFASQAGRSGPRGRQASGKVVEQCAFHCVPVVDTYYVSREPVRVNGVDMVPRPGAAIVLAVGGLYSTQFSAQHASYLVSSSADVLLEHVPLQLASPFDYSVGPSETSAHLADFDIKHPLPFLPEFSDLPLTGTLSADLVPGGATQVAANVALPEVFADDEGHGLTTSLTLRTDNANGLYLNSFHLSIPNADLGEVGIENASLDYSRAAGTLEGQASVALPSGDTATAAIGFLKGDFNKFSFDYAFGPGEGIEIYDGIYLTELFGGLRLKPAELEGGARVSIGPSVTKQGCGTVDVRGNLTVHFGPLPFAIGGTGENEILCQSVGTRYFHVDSEGHAEIASAVGFTIKSPTTGEEPPIAKIKGELKGQTYVDLTDRVFHFQFDGVEEAALNAFELQAFYKAELVVSDLGFGLCYEIDGPFGSKWHPGFGEDFAKVDPLVLTAGPAVAYAVLVKNLTFELDSCNVAQYRSLPTSASAASAAASTRSGRARAAAGTFDVPAGERTAILVLHGAGGAPNVILHGPGGRTIDATHPAPTIAADELVLHAPGEGLTEIQIRGRNAGPWTIEPAPGSPAIAHIGLSHELAPPRILAHVSGHGPRRVLHYSARLPAGTRITFLEQGVGGSKAIGSTTRAHGQIAFVPSTARPGRRTIVAALVSPAGTPEPSLKVTAYVASPPAPGRPGRVHVRRTRFALQIAFKPAHFAKKQIVTVHLSDGRRLMFVLKGSRHRLTVRSVPRRVRVLSVRVRGEGFGRLGPVAGL